MRIHFWAAREIGLNQHRVFWDWYKVFIKHFVRVYEQTAPGYVDLDADWAAKQGNIQAYLGNNCKMTDL
jgi:hypothetical protein